MWVHQSQPLGQGLRASQLRNGLYERAEVKLLSGDIAAFAVALAALQS